MQSKEDVLNREPFVKQIVDLIKILSEKRKNCCFAIEVLCWKRFKNVFKWNNQKQQTQIVFLLLDMIVGGTITMKNL